MDSRAINLQDSLWIPPTYDIPRRDFFTEFLIIVALPLTVALLLFVIFSIVMFGRRQGLDKRNQTTPEPQLVQFDTIRRATNNLRYMSNRRDCAAPIACGSPRLTTSTPNFPIEPLARSTPETRNSLPPPPYRLPPSYSPDNTIPRRSATMGGNSHDTSTLPARLS